MELLKETLSVADTKVRYDDACKKVLSYKIILAYILKYCIKEYFSMDIDDIISCIEEPVVGKQAVDQDHSIPRIRGLANEDYSIEEGKRYFDVLFESYVQKDNERIKLIINVEAQNSELTQNILINRAIYYVSRMISSQYGKEFMHSSFDDIKKVYSIWIVMNPAGIRRNTIKVIEFNELDLEGSYPIKKEYYDKMSIIMINLGEESNHKLLYLLNTLFSQQMKYSEKMEIIEEELEINFNNDEERGVEDMCNLSECIWERGIEKGIKQGFEIGEEQGIEKGIKQGIEKNTILSIKNLMESLQCDIEYAMKLLKINEEDYDKYIRLITH